MRSPGPVVVATGFLVTSALMGACGPRTAVPPSSTLLEGPTMGTEYHVLIAAEDFSEGARQEADRALRSALTEVDDLMTTYRESEVTRFNAWRETTPFAVSQPTARVVDLALRLAQETDGALDITVAPLVRALGFGPDAVTSPPSLERLTTFRQRIGSHLLRLEDQRLTKLDPRLEIDLSALAKGYAVDRAAEALDRLGLTDYMIEVGGEVRARGFNDRGERWRIGVERPDTARRTVQKVIPLADMAMATSGDYRNYREVDGERVSHLIDPRTLRPIGHRVASATVLHPESATADGLATAMMVLGEEGLDLAERHDWAVMLLVRDGDRFLERESAAFTRLIGSNPPVDS